MELTETQMMNILKRFPSFEASYETILHKNLPTNANYNIVLAIPFGKKYYMWMTFYQDKNVCFLMELNRDKKIIRISIIETNVSQIFSLGTILYVSRLESETEETYFIEDLYLYKGISMAPLTYSDKLGYMEDFLQNTSLPIYLPILWWIGEKRPTISYPVHHIQYRCLLNNSPYLNQPEDKSTSIKKSVKEHIIQESQFKTNIKKPQYHLPTIFLITADIKFDIYHLYAYGHKKKEEYVGIAYIPTYTSSVFMNSLFRKIRENENLDYIEESEDEEDFENIKEDKYVNLKKKLLMECHFHPKFKKWVPIKVVDNRHIIVHIHKL